MKSAKTIGLWSATALVAGNIIGAGAYMLPSLLAPYGKWGLVGWLIAGIGAVALALVFAQMANWVPTASGPYSYTKLVFGDFVGFQVAFGYWFVCSAGNALLVFTIIGYMSVFVPALKSDHDLALIISLVLIWGATIINVIGIKFASAVQVCITILKLIPLALFAVLGLFFFSPDVFCQAPLSANTTTWEAMSSTTSVALLSFLGLESATIPAGETHNPQKTIPRATILGVLIALFVYVLGTIVIMGSIPQTVLAKSLAPYVDSCRVLFGETAAKLMGIMGIIGCIGTLNGWVLLQGQAPLTAAREGLLPAVFMRVNKNGVPVFSLVLGSVMMSVVAVVYYSYNLLKQVEYIGLLNVFTAVVPYLYVSIAAGIFAKKMRSKISIGHFRTIVALSAVAFIFSFWVIAGFSAETVFWGMMWFLVGIPLYLFIGKTKSRTGLSGN
ncbi:MAG: amino acid permease [Holosporales bacterium]|jgi:APA family basic amino acid/polyamine antiporter|nr:amino acid permease [Holosporales bacterium]